MELENLNGNCSVPAQDKYSINSCTQLSSTHLLNEERMGDFINECSSHEVWCRCQSSIPHDLRQNLQCMEKDVSEFAQQPNHSLKDCHDCQPKEKLKVPQADNCLHIASDTDSKDSWEDLPSAENSIGVRFKSAKKQNTSILKYKKCRNFYGKSALQTNIKTRTGKRSPRCQTQSSADKFDQKPRKESRCATSAPEIADKTGLLCLEKCDHDPDNTLSDGELYIDESDGTEKHIYIDRSVDKTIEQNAAKNNLTTSNVKSILRSLITHELVQTMLKNTLESSTVKQAGTVYEPKLTRSKMKEVLEKGSEARLWPVSPAKLGQSSTSGPSILDVDFSDEEDEEDDEYKPDKDTEEFETDDESVISSQTSEFGSPVCSTPLRPITPLSMSDTSCCKTPTSASYAQAHCCLMGPPSDLPARPFVRHALQFSSEVQASETTQETSKDVIAGRTRSKHPLTATSLYDIEEAFVAPDITPDMYDTHCDDSDWQEFLRGLHKCSADQDVQNESAETADDEQNDPEFNYLAEAETEELEKDDFRFDKPFRIPRKELNELIDELDELFNDEDRTLIGLRTNLATAQENVALLSSKKTCQAREIAPHVQLERISVTEDQMLQIQEQMRKHVQLTCQMYVLACGRQEYNKIADTCAMLLGELDFFRSVSSAAEKSSYNVCNLSQAVIITKQNIDWVAARNKINKKGLDSNMASSDDLDCNMASSSSVNNRDRVHAPSCLSPSSMLSVQTHKPQEINSAVLSSRSRVPIHRPLLLKQKEILWNSPVFMYPELLPKVALLPQSECERNCKVPFTTSEDILLVLGLDQFKHTKKPYSYIQQLLMPCKSAHQMTGHIKYLSSTRSNKNNVIWQYKHNGKLPELPQRVEHFCPSMFKAPKDQCSSLLPSWCQTHQQYLEKQRKSQQAAGQMMLFKASLSSMSCEGNDTSRKRKQPEMLGDQSYSSSSDSSSDSEPDRDVQQNALRKFQPPVNRHQIRLKRHKFRKNCRGTNMYISTPVTVLPSSQGPPSAIVTSMGIFVPIHLASPAKLNSVFAQANISCSSGSKQQPCVTTTQLLNLGAVDSELSDKATESEAPTGAQNHGVDGSTDRITDPVETIGASVGVCASSDHTVNGEMLQAGHDTYYSDSGYDLGQPSDRWQDSCNSSIDRQVSCVLDEDTCLHGQQTNVHSHFASSKEQNCYHSSCHADSVVRHVMAVTLPGSVHDGDENTTEGCMRSGRVQQVMDRSRAGTERQEEVIQSSTVTSGWDSDEDNVSTGNESSAKGGAVECCPLANDGSSEDEPGVMEPDSTSSSVDVHLQSCEKEQAECIMDKELQGGQAEGKGVNLGPAVTVTSDIVQMALDSICCYSSKQFFSCCQEKSFDSSLVKEWHKNLLGPAVTSIFAVTSQEVGRPVKQGNDESSTPVDNEDNPHDNAGTLEEVEQTSHTNCADSPQSSDINKQWRRDNNTETMTLDSASDPRSITKWPEGEMSGPSPDVYVSSSGLCMQRPPVVPPLSTVCNLEAEDLFSQQNFPEESREKEEDPVRDSNENCLHQGKLPNTSVAETSCDRSEESLQMQTSKAHVEGDGNMDHGDIRTDPDVCMDGNLVGENIGIGILSQSHAADWSQSEHLTQSAAPESRTVAAESLSDQLYMQLLNERSPSKNRTSAAAGHSTRSGMEAVPRLAHVITSSTVGYAHRHSASSFAISPTLPVLSSSSVFQATPSSSLPAGSSGPHAPQMAKQIKSPKGLCPIAPKPGAYILKSPQLNPTSSATCGRTRGKEVSPKKRQLQRQVRAILPRGYTYEMKITSPTKAAAKSLKRKATLICQRTSPAKPILPKTTSMTQGQSSDTGESPRWTRRGVHRAGRKLKEKSSCKREEVTKVGLVGRVAGDDRSHEESDGTASDMEEGAALSQEDSQNEDDADGGDETYVSQLMAASTTIGFDPRKRLRLDKDSSSQGTMSKAEMRKEQKLAILAPDIMETDPKRDVRDTAFAQAYLNKLKVSLQNDPHTYSKLMQLLVQFEKDNGSPVQVYQEVCVLLQNYPQLLEEFATFLSPSQALLCNCLQSLRQFADARTFLRRLELHFEKSQAQFQRILRAISRWSNKSGSPAELRQALVPLLRSAPQYLLHDLSRFLPDDRPPDSHADDFEDITLDDSDASSPDEFEEVELVEENDSYRTKRCPCSCHTDLPTTRRCKRVGHCLRCSLKVFNGRLYFQPSNVTSRRPATVTFHDPIPMPTPCDPPPPYLFHQHQVQEVERGGEEKCGEDARKGETRCRQEGSQHQVCGVESQHQTCVEDNQHQVWDVEGGKAKEDLQGMCAGAETPLVRVLPTTASTNTNTNTSMFSGEGLNHPDKPDEPHTSCGSSSVTPASEGETSGCVSGHMPPLNWPPSTLLAANNGTVLFAGPDNTVIMVNPAVATRGERMPARQESRCVTVRDEDRCITPDSAARVAADRTFYSAVPSVSSHNRTSPSSHDGLVDLLTKTDSAAGHWVPPLSQESALVNTGSDMRNELPHLVTSSNMLGPTETTVHQQCQEDLTQNSLSLPSLLTDDSNTCSDLLAKAMKFAHIRHLDSTHSVPCNLPDDQISVSVGDALVPHCHSSHEMTEAVSHGVDTKWSREADRLILETVKQQGPTPETYEWLARQLSIWTSEQVSDRFDHLMQLFSDGHETDEEDMEPSPVS